MTDTPNLGLPYIDGSQAQKHVTHNEALRILDAAIQIGVLDQTLTAPPSSPAEGERHVVASGATGAWAGQDNTIATWQDGAWAFLAPKTGWCIWSVADSSLFVFDGAAWQSAGGPSVLDNLAHLGVNTAASSPNLLSIQSNAALFAAIDAAGGGTGDMRLQVSKESSTNTASIFFSDNFSGRAEFGLVGADTFKLKVSPDGSSWTEAFNIDQASGNLTLPRALSLTGVIAPAQITTDQNDYNPAGLAAASVLQISSNAARSVSGLAGGAEGRCLTVINVGSQPVTLLNENASSSASNRLTLGADLTISAKQAAILRYDGTAARWQAIAGAGTAIGKAILGASDASAARAALELETAVDGEVTRQNILLNRIYQAKLFGGYRRVINAFADGYKASDGIAAGSSSNYTIDTTNGLVKPTIPNATSSANPTQSLANGGLTMIDRGWSITNGATVKSIGLYLTSAKTVTVKIAQRVSAGSYNIVVSQSFSHPGGGWADCVLSSPYSVPGSGSYYAAAWTPTGSVDSSANGATRSYVSGDVTSSSVAMTEDAGQTTLGLRALYASSNMTVVTTAQTADSSVSNGCVLLEYDASASPTLNTDLTVEVTCDGGSHWTSAALSGVSAHGQSGRAVAETVDQSCTAGTSFAARIKTLTNKNIPIYGTSLTVH
jgi:hypothetical protein